LPGSTKSRALVGAENIPLQNGPLRIVEGGPDFLAACCLYWEELGDTSCTPHLPLATLSGSWFPRKVHAMQFNDRDIQLVAHCDDAGEKQMQKNANVLTDCGARVTIIKLQAIWPEAKQKSDLNDLIRERPELTKKLYRKY
jgi:hypothetical protein